MKQSFILLCLLFSLTAGAQDVEVTFQVDMSGIAVSADGIYVAGDLNGWTPDATQLTQVGSSNVYAVTVSLQSGRDIQYKFINGNSWGNEEVPPLTCAVNGNNRVFTTPLENVTLPIVPFGGCSAGMATKMVTFRVDMSNQTVDPDGVHVAGNFQGWSPGSTPLTDIGGGIYEATVPVLNSLIVLQYKFLNGNEWGVEEDPPAGCENFDNNRVAIAIGTEDIILPLQTFAGCENPIPTKDVTFQVDMAGFDVSPNGVHLAGNLQGWNPGNTPMSPIGNGIYQVTIPVPAAVVSIEYKFVNGDEWGFEEDPPEGCQNNDNNRFAALPLTTEAVRLPGVKFGSCETITSLTELLGSDEFQIFPSVSNGQISIRWQSPHALPLTLTVLDMNGRTMAEEKVPPTSILVNRNLDVSTWAPGMYLVYLHTSGSHSVRKLIVR